MHNQRGFSLVELSIVLVILGLLTGGILAGQSLIRAAELRALSTESSKYKAAVNSFRDKYFGIPGDLRKATDFWGPPGGNIANCPATAGTGTQTCNGDGDGIIAPSVTTGNNYIESFMFWQHLANAGLIEGSYSGRIGPAGNYDITADNSPRSKLPNGIWFPFNWNTTLTASTSFDGTYRDNMLQLGAYASAGSSPANVLLKPEELWNMDTKLDDGKPALGIVRTRFWSGCTTATASSQTNADYALSTNSPQCVAFVIL